MLRTSHSQPHLSLAARRPADPPLEPGLRSAPSQSQPALHNAPYQQRGQSGGGQPGGLGLGRSSSAATFATIAEELDPSEKWRANALATERERESYAAVSASRANIEFEKHLASARQKQQQQQQQAPPRPPRPPSPFQARPADALSGAATEALSGAASSHIDRLLIHHAAGRQAPPTWAVRAMRALAMHYEKQLADAREAVVKAEAVARAAAFGIVAVDADIGRRDDYAASSLARASAASEAAARRQDISSLELSEMREAVVHAQRAAAAADARCIVQESQLRQLHEAVEEAREKERSAHEAAEDARGLALSLSMSLEATRDELAKGQQNQEILAAECARSQEEASRLREHARELAQGPAAQPRLGGAPLPSAMGSPAEWEALREERDSLVKLLIELKRMSDEKGKGAHAVRVGGGYERLPDYLAKFTGVLPPELRVRDVRVATAEAELSAEEAMGAGGDLHAPTHRARARAVAAAVRARGRAGPQAWGPSPRTDPAVGTPRPWRGGAAAVQRIQAGAQMGVAGRPYGVLLHSQGPPPESILDTLATRGPRKEYWEQVAKPDERGDFRGSDSGYPALAHTSVFIPKASEVPGSPQALRRSASEAPGVTWARNGQNLADVKQVPTQPPIGSVWRRLDELSPRRPIKPVWRGAESPSTDGLR